MRHRHQRLDRELFVLQRALDEQSGGDHRFELIVAAAQRSSALLRHMVRNGYDLNQFNEHGRTPLYWLIGEGDLDAVNRLLALKADPNRCQAGDVSPLMYAAHLGNLALVETLLIHGANAAYQDRDGATAAQIAEQAGHGAVRERLG
jgi:ankyrin repeat protein